MLKIIFILLVIFSSVKKIKFQYIKKRRTQRMKPKLNYRRTNATRSYRT